LLISPWLVAVASRHGIGAFIDAMRTTERESFDALIAYAFLFLLTAPVIGLLDILGQVQQVLSGKAFLLAWRIGVFAIDTRFSPISGAAPASMLAAHGLLDVMTPAVWNVVGRRGDGLDERGRVRWRRRIVGVAMVLAFVPTALGTQQAIGPAGALSEAQRDAMYWVRDNTDMATITVSLAGAMWGSDDVSEWFPALSLRRSASTTQGTEWDASVGAPIRAAESELRECGSAGTDVAACVDDWIGRNMADHQWVLYVDRSARAKGHEPLAEVLARTYGYRELSTSAEGVLLGPASRASSTYLPALELSSTIEDPISPPATTRAVPARAGPLAVTAPAIHAVAHHARDEASHVAGDPRRQTWETDPAKAP
jgi:hypothetical protein